ncbi:carbamoyltransferase family protein [Spartinivicinus poritis]|uniref:Carbamoyltransferase n=1 Tax=Spartinivicinus poritis TaxID=2994640 RepID=A0ABT5U836_9GAMM|nr:carbamoyltransferase C-terminal domain-containing protein [Spartinivicinus sp. A2-2]MDE1462520.1 hypothetical protein [Spartinivicinus sp. A2-2]
MIIKNILGVGFGGSMHNSGATLIKDGEILTSIEEERISRVKEDGSFPSKAIQFCLESNGIKPEEIDLVVLGWENKRQHKDYLNLLLAGDIFSKYTAVNKLGYLCFQKITMNRYLDKLKSQFPNAAVETVSHHQAHAYSTYYASPFDDSLVVTWDGRGEYESATAYNVKNGKFDLLKRQVMPESLGFIYLAVTQFIGFDFGDEYKVMGLASYGEPIYLDKFREIIKLDDETMYKIEPGYLQHWLFHKKCPQEGPFFGEKFVALFGEPAPKGVEPSKREVDIAASLQARLNEVCSSIVQSLVHETGIKKLCLAGGVALNGVANHYVLKNSGIEDIFIQPASGDGGISLGAAYWGYHHYFGCKTKIPFDHAYKGATFTNEQINAELAPYNLNSYRLKKKAKTIATLLNEGKVIGLFQGTGEIGPRALGSRSILADPRPSEHKELVNSKIKFREGFRPFAPSILADYACDYLDIEGPSEYMLLIAEVKEQYRDYLGAVTHINNTARPQTVEKDVNPEYYSIISVFYELTGCPAVLNTSFNVKGEPVVHTPTDAIRCFFSTGLDYLVVGDLLFSKNKDFSEIQAIEGESHKHEEYSLA